MEKLRLDRLLASTGAWSRREVKLLVRQGRVLADGSPHVQLPIASQRQLHRRLLHSAPDVALII